MNTAAAMQAFRFLDLPAEMRNRIHEFAFEAKSTGTANKLRALHRPRAPLPGHATAIALLQTCRQVQREAEGIFCNFTKIILVNTYLPAFIDTTSTARLSKITTLSLRMESGVIGGVKVDQIFSFLKGAPGARR